MSNVLTLSGITKTYNPGKRTEVSVLKGADLSVEQGEIIGLIAPSGAS
jgi:lipoprotein-releasing system ATP-binding protein